MRRIGLGELPGVSRLFSDYVARRPPASALFDRDPRSDAAVVSLAGILAGRDYSRETLAATLLRQNKDWGAGEKTLRNCRALARADCLAVVTGQQVGLFGGPLLTLLKALHAVKLAGVLAARLSRPVVPIFWLELEDHDLNEVNRITVMGRDRELHQLILTPDAGVGRRPVNRIGLGRGVAALLDELEAAWPETEFSAGVLAALRRAYSPAADFGRGFAEYFIGLVTRFGLVPADPSDGSFKEAARKVFRAEIEKPAAARHAFIEHERAIAAAGYERQVETPDGALHLFVKRGGVKYRLAKRGDEFRLIGSDVRLGEAELIGIAEESPSELVPAVLLRPLVQDTLFPTLAYVAGPAEVSYLAQATPLYRSLGVPMPLVVPRAGVTVLTAATLRNMQKYSLGIEDLFVPRGDLVRRALESQAPAGDRELFAGVRRGVSEAVAGLGGSLSEGDEGLRNLIEKTKQNIDGLLEKLEGKYIKAAEKRSELPVQQIGKLSTSVFPGGMLQERVFPAAQFLNSFGEEFVDLVFDAIDPLNPAHCFLEV